MAVAMLGKGLVSSHISVAAWLSCKVRHFRRHFRLKNSPPRATASKNEEDLRPWNYQGLGIRVYLNIVVLVCLLRYKGILVTI